jgi:hypothetical protein
VELEQKKLTLAESLEIGAASGLPEVDLIDAGERR